MDEWVRLTSNDGYHYLVKRKVAMCSGTLKNMLSAESPSPVFSSISARYLTDIRKSGNFSEALSNACPVDER